MSSRVLNLVLLSAVGAEWVPPWEPPAQDFTQCETDIFFNSPQYTNMKGLVLDDISFRYCASRIPRIWPNVKNVAVGSLRIFRSWNSDWPRERRDGVLGDIVAFVHLQNVKVLVGTPVTCDAEADDQDWKWTKDLLQRLGAQHVMGIAVGNELELLYNHKSVPQDCIDELWDRGRLWRTFQQRIAEADEMGFSSVPITSVFTSTIVYSGAPSLAFMNIPHQARVNDFLRNATSAYYGRFVFVVNIYPYFDPTLRINPPHETCETAIEIATCFNRPECLTNKNLAEVKAKVKQLTNGASNRIWIGEIGWSSPKADALSTNMAACPTFSSMATLSLFYKNFLKWDLSTSASGRPDADHAFYFTMRDAMNFGNQEYFGLLQSCNNADCKIHSKGYVAPDVLRRYSWLNVFFAVAGSVFVLMAFGGAACATAADRRRSRKAAQLSSSSSSEDSSGEG